jgi:sodium transport system permease protein
MRVTITIFLKELKDTLRDRRTLFAMILAPILVFPVMITLSVNLMKSQVKKAEDKVLRIGLESAGNAADIRDSLLARSDMRVVEDLDVDRMKHLIQTDSLDAALVFSSDFDTQIESHHEGSVQLLHKSAEAFSTARTKLRELLSAYERRVVSARFKDLRVDEAITSAMEIQHVDISTRQEKFGKVIGGFLPYIFVLFCFMGCMYPAIDLGAGEKERGTLETLLSSPATRMQILLGKFGVIVLTGITSAIVSVLGLYASVRLAVQLPPMIQEMVSGLLQISSLLMVISLLVPLTIFFAALLLSFSIYARSFKEAQSIISPLTLLIIIPVFIGLIPGIKLNGVTALIPILNVSLASREILSGTISYPLLAEVYASLIVLAAAGLTGCAKWFGREQTIFRST